MMQFCRARQNAGARRLGGARGMPASWQVLLAFVCLCGNASGIDQVTLQTLRVAQTSTLFKVDTSPARLAWPEYAECANV